MLLDLLVDAHDVVLQIGAAACEEEEHRLQTVVKHKITNEK